MALQRCKCNFTHQYFCQCFSWFGPNWSGHFTITGLINRKFNKLNNKKIFFIRWTSCIRSFSLQQTTKISHFGIVVPSCTVRGNSSNKLTSIRSRRRTIEEPVRNYARFLVLQLGFREENFFYENQIGCWLFQNDIWSLWRIGDLLLIDFKEIIRKNDYKLNYENLNLNLTSRKIFAYKGSTYSRMNKYIDLLISMEGKKTYRIIQRLEVLVVLARFGILVVNAWM